MAQAKLTLPQAQLLIALRSHPNDTARKAMKAELFKMVKAAFRIPAEHKLTVEIDNPNSINYLLLRRKKNGLAYTLDGLGRWEHAAPDQQPAPPVERNFTVSWSTTQQATNAQEAAQAVADTYFVGPQSFNVTDDSGLTSVVDVSDLD